MTPTIAYIFEIAHAIAELGALILLGCIVLELRQARHNQAARESQRRQWVKEEHREG